MFSAPLVVGYKGEIGRFILACLLEDMPKANDILCVDVNNSEQDVVERIEKADYIFLCVPLQFTEAWLERYREALVGKTIVEQSSVKAFLFENPKLKDLSFLSMHLLFRPSATAVEDRRGLVFGDHLPTSELEEFRAYSERAFRTKMIILGGEDEPSHLHHDRLMAREQGLVHRVILTLAESLDEESVRTYVGQRVCELAQRIRLGDPVLYRIIQENPFLGNEVDGFQKDLEGFAV